MEFARLSPGRPVVRFALILIFTLLGFAVMGYHPGYEDDGVYLAAVKADLQPALYPHDAAFFRLQLQATVFDGALARFVHWTGMPLAWAELLWQLATIFGTLWACHSIARQLFEDARAQWAGVAMVAAMLTLPVAGTALNLADQHLHPRNIATALILMAVARILAGRRRQALALLAAAMVMHPIMGVLGISFCAFLALSLRQGPGGWLRGQTGSLAAAVPLGWIFEPPTPNWHRALNTRTYYFLYQWTWYEWLGALGPLALFWLLWRMARRRGQAKLARFALAVLAYGVFQQALAMAVLAPAALVRVTPLQPMRYLQLEYFFLALMAGCLLGSAVLRARAWRWVVYLALINGGMFAAQRALLPASQHLELPGRAPANPWLQAFQWVRRNTPVTAYFALDPRYLALPGEDYHSFRALAERSQLADAIKDASVVTQVPELGDAWARQVDAQAGWNRFQIKDFERLKREFGVDWVLVDYPQPGGLDCRWHNERLAVCQIP